VIGWLILLALVAGFAGAVLDRLYILAKMERYRLKVQAYVDELQGELSRVLEAHRQPQEGYDPNLNGGRGGYVL